MSIFNRLNTFEHDRPTPMFPKDLKVLPLAVCTRVEHIQPSTRFPHCLRVDQNTQCSCHSARPLEDIPKLRKLLASTSAVCRQHLVINAVENRVRKADLTSLTHDKRQIGRVEVVWPPSQIESVQRYH